MFEMKEETNSAMMFEPPDLKHLPDKSPAEKLILLLEFINHWDEFLESSRQDAMNIFMGWLGYLYLDYFQYHLDEASKIGEKYQDILSKLSVKPVAKYYVAPFVYAMNDEYGDLFWREACEIRTHMQAFQEMFGDYVERFKSNGWAFKRLYEYLDLCRRFAIHLTDEEIPLNVPESHWWWFFKSEHSD